ncbi:hypothetical protein [Actinoplanes sp. NPDC048796]
MVTVAERKPKIRVETDRGPVDVFLPQAHQPGERRPSQRDNPY